MTMGKADFGTRRDGGGRQDRQRDARRSHRAETIAIINYTGGTTGKSKGAIRRHAQVAASRG